VLIAQDFLRETAREAGMFEIAESCLEQGGGAVKVAAARRQGTHIRSFKMQWNSLCEDCQILFLKRLAAYFSRINP